MLDRQNAMLDYLCDTETAGVNELANHFGVSKMTIHRDIDRLVELRLVRKVRGGVTALPSLSFEASYHFRLRQQQTEKRVLAERIAGEIEPGMAVILDDSSTTAALLEFLPDLTPLTVISNARRVIDALVPDDRFSVISLGGCYEATADAFLGLTCELALKQLSADLAVFSAARVQGGRAFLHAEEIVRVKKAMQLAATRSVLAFDPSKFNKSALHLFDELNSFDRVLTLNDVNRATADALRSADVPLELVALPANQAKQTENQTA